MQMQMINQLAAATPDVENQFVTGLIQAKIFCRFFGRQKHGSYHFFVFRLQIVYGINVSLLHFRDNQEVDWGAGTNVLKNHQLIGIINYLRRQLFIYDFAKKTSCHKYRCQYTN